jgi:DNA helicase-2/ATP-dependent DNA helicase PcrA
VDQIYQVLCRLKAGLKTHQFEEDDFRSFGLYEIVEQLDLPQALVEICAAYERRRQMLPGEFSWQTEEDLVPDLVWLLTHYPNAIDVLPRVSCMLVDEWHDVNAAEFELIRLLRRNARLVVVADRDQVIDENRGAELRFSTTEFDAIYKPMRLPLKQSRRFGPTLARRATSLVSRKVESIGGGLHTVIHKLYYDPTDRTACARVIVEHVQELYEAEHSVRHSDIAIVIRAEDHSIEIENLLLDHGKIPYACEGISSYLLRPEILMLRALLHVISGYYDTLRSDLSMTHDLVSALAMFVSMSSRREDWEMDAHQAFSRSAKDPLERAKEEIGKEPSALGWFLTGVLCQAHKVDQSAMRRWKARLKEFVETMMPNADSLSAAELLTLASQKLDLAAAVHRAYFQRSQADSAARSIRSFIKFAEKFPSHSLRQFLDELFARQQKMAAFTRYQRSGPQITIATIRSAKGQEWKHVVLPYLQDKEFPRGRDMAEESRFLYVAMTRAQESLAIAEPSEEFRTWRSPLLHGPRARRMEEASQGE